LDYTVDAVDTMQNVEKVPLSEVYERIISKQEEIINQIDNYKENHFGDHYFFKDLYDNVLSFNYNYTNKLIPELEKENEGEKKFTCTKLIRSIFSLLSILSLVSLVMNQVSSQ